MWDGDSEGNLVITGIFCILRLEHSLVPLPRGYMAVPAPAAHPTLRVRPEQEQELCTWLAPSGCEVEPQKVCARQWNGSFSGDSSILVAVDDHIIQYLGAGL